MESNNQGWQTKSDIDDLYTAETGKKHTKWIDTEFYFQQHRKFAQ